MAEHNQVIDQDFWVGFFSLHFLTTLSKKVLLMAYSNVFVKIPMNNVNFHLQFFPQITNLSSDGLYCPHTALIIGYSRNWLLLKESHDNYSIWIRGGLLVLHIIGRFCAMRACPMTCNVYPLLTSAPLAVDTAAQPWQPQMFPDIAKHSLRTQVTFPRLPGSGSLEIRQ